METAILLAKFWGWFLTISCLIFFLRRNLLEELFRLLEDKGFVILSGYLASLIGLVSIILHNFWVSNWRVIITIFGWVSLIKGITRLAFPEAPSKTAEKLRKNPALIQLLLIFGIILGVFLIWKSYNLLAEKLFF